MKRICAGYYKDTMMMKLDGVETPCIVEVIKAEGVPYWYSRIETEDGTIISEGSDWVETKSCAMNGLVVCAEKGFKFDRENGLGWYLDI